MTVISNVKNIFISYSSTDIATVDPVKIEIKGNNMQVWIDQDNLPKESPTAPYWDAIGRNITDSEYFLIFLSDNSKENENIIKELKIAKGCQENKNVNFILPIVMSEKIFQDGIKDNEGNILLQFKGWEGTGCFKFYGSFYRDAKIKLLQFLMGQLKVPQFISSELHLLSYTLFYKIGNDEKFLKFKTFFLFDILYDMRKRVLKEFNAISFRKKYSCTLEGSYFQIQINVKFHLLTGTIKEVNYKINSIQYDVK